MPPELFLSWEYEEQEQPLIEQDPLPRTTSSVLLWMAMVVGFGVDVWVVRVVSEGNGCWRLENGRSMQGAARLGMFVLFLGMDR